MADHNRESDKDRMAADEAGRMGGDKRRDEHGHQNPQDRGPKDRERFDEHKKHDDGMARSPQGGHAGQAGQGGPADHARGGSSEQHGQAGRPSHKNG
ncbi:MAG TPA: hypothetical protein VFB15_00815 [Candidatus Binataceae bacterium]|nr:hypothetical protein [Candidatus Binataceae bacterium]